MSSTFTDSDEPSELLLGQNLINANQWMSSSLLNLMHERGHRILTSTHLSFFCSLDCGITHASAVARRMGISRQAVYKITKELQRLKVLSLIEAVDDRRQKAISMTELGENVAMDARACMTIIEKHLASQIGNKNMKGLIEGLQQNWGPVLGSNQTD